MNPPWLRTFEQVVAVQPSSSSSSAAAAPPNGNSKKVVPSHATTQVAPSGIPRLGRSPSRRPQSSGGDRNGVVSSVVKPPTQSSGPSEILSDSAAKASSTALLPPPRPSTAGGGLSGKNAEYRRRQAEAKRKDDEYWAKAAKDRDELLRKKWEKLQPHIEATKELLRREREKYRLINSGIGLTPGLRVRLEKLKYNPLNLKVGDSPTITSSNGQAKKKRSAPRPSSAPGGRAGAEPPGPADDDDRYGDEDFEEKGGGGGGDYHDEEWQQDGESPAAAHASKKAQVIGTSALKSRVGHASRLASLSAGQQYCHRRLVALADDRCKAVKSFRDTLHREEVRKALLARLAHEQWVRDNPPKSGVENRPDWDNDFTSPVESENNKKDTATAVQKARGATFRGQFGPGYGVNIMDLPKRGGRSSEGDDDGVVLDGVERALAAIKQPDLLELGSFFHPPDVVKGVVGTLCVLLGITPSWEVAYKGLLRNSYYFLTILRFFDKNNISEAALWELQRFIARPELEEGVCRHACKALVFLRAWIVAVWKYVTGEELRVKLLEKTNKEAMALIAVKEEKSKAMRAKEEDEARKNPPKVGSNDDYEEEYGDKDFEPEGDDNEEGEVTEKFTRSASSNHEFVEYTHEPPRRVPEVERKLEAPAEQPSRNISFSPPLAPPPSFAPTPVASAPVAEPTTAADEGNYDEDFDFEESQNQNAQAAAILKSELEELKASLQKAKAEKGAIEEKLRQAEELAAIDRKAAIEDAKAAFERAVEDAKAASERAVEDAKAASERLKEELTATAAATVSDKALAVAAAKVEARREAAAELESMRVAAAKARNEVSELQIAAKSKSRMAMELSALLAKEKLMRKLAEKKAASPKVEQPKAGVEREKQHFETSLLEQIFDDSTEKDQSESKLKLQMDAIRQEVARQEKLAKTAEMKADEEKRIAELDLTQKNVIIDAQDGLFVAFTWLLAREELVGESKSVKPLAPASEQQIDIVKALDAASFIEKVESFTLNSEVSKDGGRGLEVAMKGAEDLKVTLASWADGRAKDSLAMQLESLTRRIQDFDRRMTATNNQITDSVESICKVLLAEAARISLFGETVKVNEAVLTDNERNLFAKLAANEPFGETKAEIALALVVLGDGLSERGDTLIEERKSGSIIEGSVEIGLQETVYAEAARCFVIANCFKPNDPLILTKLGGACSDIGLNEQAVALLSRSSELRKHDDAMTSYKLANALHSIQDYFAAAEKYKLASEIAAKSNNHELVTECLRKQAVTLEINLGLNNMALEVYELAAQLNPTAREFQYAIANCLEKTDKVAEANLQVTEAGELIEIAGTSELAEGSVAKAAEIGETQTTSQSDPISLPLLETAGTSELVAEANLQVTESGELIEIAGTSELAEGSVAKAAENGETQITSQSDPISLPLSTPQTEPQPASTEEEEYQADFAEPENGNENV